MYFIYLYIYIFKLRHLFSKDEFVISPKHFIQLNVILLNIGDKINVSCAPNQHIRMISEGSRDTEDWSNNENDDFVTEINKTFKYRKTVLNCELYLNI